MTATPEEFVEAWQNSSSRKEVASKLNMKLASVKSRCSIYRKHGVKLKRFISLPPALDWKRLQKFAKVIEARMKENNK